MVVWKKKEQSNEVRNATVISEFLMTREADRIKNIGKKKRSCSPPVRWGMRDTKPLTREALWTFITRNGEINRRNKWHSRKKYTKLVGSERAVGGLTEYRSWEDRSTSKAKWCKENFRKSLESKWRERDTIEQTWDQTSWQSSLADCWTGTRRGNNIRILEYQIWDHRVLINYTETFKEEETQSRPINEKNSNCTKFNGLPAPTRKILCANKKVIKRFW